MPNETRNLYELSPEEAAEAVLDTLRTARKPLTLRGVAEATLRHMDPLTPVTPSLVGDAMDIVNIAMDKLIVTRRAYTGRNAKGVPTFAPLHSSQKVEDDIAEIRRRFAGHIVQPASTDSDPMIEIFAPLSVLMASLGEDEP